MHSIVGPCGDIHLGHFKKNINWIELLQPASVLSGSVNDTNIVLCHKKCLQLFMQGLHARFDRKQRHGQSRILIINFVIWDSKTRLQCVQLTIITTLIWRHHRFHVVLQWLLCFSIVKCPKAYSPLIRCSTPYLFREPAGRRAPLFQCISRPAGYLRNLLRSYTHYSCYSF